MFLHDKVTDKEPCSLFIEVPSAWCGEATGTFNQSHDVTALSIGRNGGGSMVFMMLLCWMGCGFVVLPYKVLHVWSMRTPAVRAGCSLRWVWVHVDWPCAISKVNAGFMMSYWCPLAPGPVEWSGVIENRMVDCFYCACPTWQ